MTARTSYGHLPAIPGRHYKQLFGMKTRNCIDFLTQIQDYGAKALS